MKVIYIIGAVVISLVFMYSLSDAAAEHQEVSKCPEGSYEIGNKLGEPICKAEPTGCVYGDSIPLEDCDKFKPRETTPVVDAPDLTGK